MRRLWLCLWLLLALTPAAPAAADSTAPLPILFVHGNGDNAVQWLTMRWRFESNGYPEDRLAAITFPHPVARAADTVAEVNRSSSAEQRQQLAEAVDVLLQQTGQDKLILVGSSRGGYAIRSFIRHGGAGKVALAILCGTPNHGVFALPYRLDSEFNGLGPFLRQLNHDPEVEPGVRTVTLRSDHLDKFAQPTGGALGFPYLPTFVSSDGPALAGAENIVLPGLDHKEVAFSRAAFAAIYRAVTGQPPVRLDIVPEASPRLSGVISGWDNGAPTNLALAGMQLDIYQVDRDSGERLGAARWHQVTGEDGAWGPFTAQPAASYEFVLQAAGYPVTRLYTEPFPRGSAQLNLRPAPAADGGRVELSRPRGYFGAGRDQVTIDGQRPDGWPPGVPSVDQVTLALVPGPPRTIVARFNDARISLRSPDPGSDQRIIAELLD